MCLTALLDLGFQAVLITYCEKGNVGRLIDGDIKEIIIFEIEA